VSFWVLTERQDGRVAVRIKRAQDRPRRTVSNDTDPFRIREEWRCADCGQWVERDALTLGDSGRMIGGVPEVVPHCLACGGTADPSGRHGRRRAHHD
jgi:hypothetical protein